MGGIWIRSKGKRIVVGRFNIERRAETRPQGTDHKYLEQALDFDHGGKFIWFLMNEWSKAETLRLP